MADRHAELILALRDLGDGLDLPPGGDPAVAAVARIRADAGARRDGGRRGGTRVAAVALAVASIVALVVVALPGPRAALGRLLGIGGVEITTGATIDPALSRTFDLGRAVPVDEGLDGFPGDPVPELGEPAQAFAGRPEGGTSLVWAPSDRLPALGDTGAGLVLTAFPTRETPGITKQAGADTGITAVRVAGRPGVWVSGPHEMAYPNPDGRVASTRLAGNTLVWTDGPTTYRLESSLSRSAAVAVAADLM
jgi:hypothetical protein